MENLASNGGVKQRRGALYQDCSQLFYILIRLMDHPDLEAMIESVEDATIYYQVQDETGTKQIIEFVQCKKREARVGGPLFAGANDADSWIAGKFDLGDLTNWIVPAREGISTAELLEREPGSFYTALVFGELAKSIAAFVPEGLKESLPVRFPSTLLRQAFPITYQHTKEPVNAIKSKFATEDVRKRIRVLSTASPKELAWMCMIMLAESEFYKVSLERVEPVLNKLLRLIQESATIQGKISGRQILEIVASGQLERGRWQTVEELLEKDNLTPSNPNKGEPLRWYDFEHGRFANRAEFQHALNAITQDGAFVAINGAVGTGKTTLCNYLMHEFVKTNQSRQAYYLAASPTMLLLDEINFMSQKIHTDTLFIVDDEHLAGKEVAALVGGFIDFKTSGNAKARLVISSKINYGRTEGLAQGHMAKELRQASHIPLPNNSIETVEKLISEIRQKTGLTSQLSDKELASLSDGVLGVGLLIAHSSQPTTATSSTMEGILTKNSLKTRLAKWVLSYLPSLHSVAEFESQVAPIFIISAFSLPVPEDYSTHIALLHSAGFLEQVEIEMDTYAYRATNINLAFIFQAQYKSAHFEILNDYIARYPQYLSRTLVRVAEWKESHGTLGRLSEGNFHLLARMIKEPTYGLSLTEITNILQSVRTASRGTSIGLVKSWLLPSKRPNEWFFRDMTSRARSASELTSFLDLLYRIDKHVGVLKTLAESPLYGLMAYEGEKILLLFEQESCRIDQAAACLHAIKRINEDFAAQLYERYKQSAVFAAKMAETQSSERGLSILLRYCEELKSVNRAESYENLESYLPPEKIVDTVLTKTETLNPISLFLVRLHRLHPRWAANILTTLWNNHGKRLEGFLRHENDLDTLTQDLYSFSKVNRLIAIKITLRILEHLISLIRAENKYPIIGAKIETIRKFISPNVARQACEAIDKEKVIALVRSERRYADVVGKFLFDLTQSSPVTSAWFEEHLDYQHLLRTTRAPRLRDAAIVVRGFLTAASFERREKLRQQMLNDSDLIKLFRNRWNEAKTLSELGFCLTALTSSPLLKSEIERLLNFSNRSELSADLYRRFERSTNILHVANGLYGTARFDLGISQAALRIYADKIETEARNSQKTSKDERQNEQEQSHGGLSRNRNLVEQGCLFHISAVVNSSDARRLINLIQPSALAEMSVAEDNLGRLTVFIGGVHQASKQYAQIVLDRICSDEQWQKQYEENEEIENVIHYVRVLSRVSKKKSADFTHFLFNKYRADIDAFLKIQANTLLISNWLRILSKAGEEYIREHAQDLAKMLVEASEYDTRLWHLLESTEALMESGNNEAARNLCNLALAGARQINAAGRLSDLVVLINKALHIERSLHIPNLTVNLTNTIEDWHISLMLAAERQIILSAYTYHLFDSSLFPPTNPLRTAVLSKQRAIIEVINQETPSVTKAIAIILAHTAINRAIEVIGEVNWKQSQAWELGLVALLFDVIYSGAGRTIIIPFDIESTEWKEFLANGLNEHAGNLEFALTLYLAQATKTAEDAIAGWRNQAVLRAEDESSSAVRWLLNQSNNPAHLTGLNYYVWSYLKETILRSTYLPWENDIGVVADSIAFDQNYFRDMPALITT